MPVPSDPWCSAAAARAGSDHAAPRGASSSGVGCRPKGRSRSARQASCLATGPAVAFAVFTAGVTTAGPNETATSDPATLPVSSFFAAGAALAGAGFGCLRRLLCRRRGALVGRGLLRLGCRSSSSRCGGLQR